MHLKILCVKWQPFCLGGDELTLKQQAMYGNVECKYLSMQKYYMLHRDRIVEEMDVTCGINPFNANIKQLMNKTECKNLKILRINILGWFHKLGSEYLQSSRQFQIHLKQIHTRWCHQMETFSPLLAFCAGNSPGHQWIPCTKASDAELWCFL